MTKFHMVAPFNRVVTEETILGWHRDRETDGEVDHTDDVMVAIADLEDLGHITIAGIVDEVISLID